MEISYNKEDFCEYTGIEKVIKTAHFVDPLELCQHGLHSLSLLIEQKKGASFVGKLGSRLVLLFIYPAKLIDRSIQLIAAPIVSFVGFLPGIVTFSCSRNT